MRPLSSPRTWTRPALLALATALMIPGLGSKADEPDPSTYWRVDEVRPGMKGMGRTVMVGAELEEFGVEVLGVMKDVSPGRDMILARLSGCNLEHAGIIQGMSGSPVYIDGKLVGAVAFAWEFAKDPIAGITPFEQMVAYVRANDRRIAAESGREEPEAPKSGGLVRTACAELDAEALWDRDRPLPPLAEPAGGPTPVSGGGLAGMRPIATPMAASGFTPRALALLAERLEPVGLAPTAGGSAQEEIVARFGDRPLVPGSPVSVAMVTGDFDLSGIGTVTHVEGDRVYAFGHPMMGQGACEFPMMTGYIHTVYPRSSVSMKLGSPLKVVGVLDTDVSTAVSGRLGRAPDMLPMTVKVQSGRFAEPHTYKVQLAREPGLLPTLVLSVLSNAIDTEGNLPDELTARMVVTLSLDGREPITIRETLSGPRYTGPTGPMALFGPVAGTVNLLVRNAFGPVRVESIDCEVAIEPGQNVAQIEAVRLASRRIEPGEVLRASVTLKPHKGARRTIELALPLPDDLPEGTYEANVCDLGRSLQRRVRNDPILLGVHDLDGLVSALRLRAEPTRTALYLHVPGPGRGLTVEGQTLPDLPGGIRAVFASDRRTPQAPVRADLIATAETPWVIEGAEAVKFEVVRDSGLARVEAD